MGISYWELLIISLLVAFLGALLIVMIAIVIFVTAVVRRNRDSAAAQARQDPHEPT